MLEKVALGHFVSEDVAFPSLMSFHLSSMPIHVSYHRRCIISEIYGIVNLLEPEFYI